MILEVVQAPFIHTQCEVIVEWPIVRAETSQDISLQL